jgi:hypothetical protein
MKANEFALVVGQGPFARVQLKPMPGWPGEPGIILFNMDPEEAADLRASLEAAKAERLDATDHRHSRSPSVAVWAIAAALLFFGSMAAAIALG